MVLVSRGQTRHAKQQHADGHRQSQVVAVEIRHGVRAAADLKCKMKVSVFKTNDVAQTAALDPNLGSHRHAGTNNATSSLALITSA